MTVLDHKYVETLVKQAQGGDANAFAELFAATYQKQYVFAKQYLQDAYLAQEALQNTFIYALQHLSRLQEPSLFLAWLNRQNLTSCFAIKKNSKSGEDPMQQSVIIGKNSHSIQQVLSLPFTQSQVLLLRYHCHLRLWDIALLMEMRATAVRRYMRDGMTRLRRVTGETTK